MSEQRVIVGHVIDRLRELPERSVHCCVTSPPYFGLRSYGTEPQTWPDGWRGELGSESTIARFVDHLVEVFAAVHRVLRDDGTCWVNIGDSYSNDGKWGGMTGGKHVNALHGDSGIGRARRQTGLKPKDLCLAPQRLAIALQDLGWHVRSIIIWAKTSCMPESVTDRPTTSHEYVLLLSKQPSYFYDAEAIREPHAEPGRGIAHRESSNPHNGRLDDAGKQQAAWVPASRQYHPSGRNSRSVWTLSPSPFPDAHFATFPPELPRRAILAGTSEKGCCSACGGAYERLVDKTYRNPGNRTTNGPRSLERRHETAGFAVRLEAETKTVGWAPTCRCDAGDPIPCTVLDPFSGSGTSGVVAAQLGRNYVGIEIKPEYAAMSLRRIEREGSPLFSTVTVEVPTDESARQPALMDLA